MTSPISTVEDVSYLLEFVEDVQGMTDEMTPYRVICVLNSVLESLQGVFVDLEFGDSVPTQMGYNYGKKGYLPTVRKNVVSREAAVLWIGQFVSRRLGLK